MVKALIGVLSLLLVLALIPVVVIACSAPSSPPAMASMAGPLSRVSFDDVPAPREYRARDGTPLRYYAYPASPDKIAVLVHGSVGPGMSMHALAKALRDAGVSAHVLDIRGHGGSGRRGDIDYIGQIVPPEGRHPCTSASAGAQPRHAIPLVGGSPESGKPRKRESRRPSVAGCPSRNPVSCVQALQPPMLEPVVGLQAFLSPPVRRTASGPSGGALTRFTDIAGALERASGAIARLDTLLTGHPLEPAWL